MKRRYDNLFVTLHIDKFHVFTPPDTAMLPSSRQKWRRGIE